MKKSITLFLLALGFAEGLAGQAVLNYFYTDIDSGKVKVKWETGTENNMNSFTVRRQSSLSPGVFTNVEIVPAYGNSSTPIQYECVDTGAWSAGVEYCYMIVMTTNDGSSYYVSIDTATCETPMAVSADDPLPAARLFIYPNPSTETFYIRYDDFHAGGFIHIEVYDLTGQKIIFRDKIKAGETRMELPALPVGIYPYRIMEGNSICKTGKLVKIE